MTSITITMTMMMMAMTMTMKVMLKVTMTVTMKVMLKVVLKVMLKVMCTRGSHWKDLNGIDRLSWRLDDEPSTSADVWIFMIIRIPMMDNGFFYHTHYDQHDDDEV